MTPTPPTPKPRKKSAPRKQAAKTAVKGAVKRAAKGAAKVAAKVAAKKTARKRGWKWSDESRAKISASATSTWQDPVVRARREAGIRRAMKRPQVRARILARSAARRGKKHTTATIRKMRASALRHRGKTNPQP